MSKRPVINKILKWLSWAKRAYEVARWCWIASAVLATGWRLAITDAGYSDGIVRRTPIGQRMTIPLGDYSSVDMNADTVALIKDVGARRRIFLVDGEVRISVTHGVSKPIDVYLPRLILEDRGTQFDVSVHETVTSVSVTAGSVQVREHLEDGTFNDPVRVADSGPRRGPLILSPGDSVRLEEHGGTTFAYLDRNDIEEAQLRSSWLLGEVATAGERLDDIIAEFNRYNRTRLVIEDPSVARMHVGGHYFLTEPDAFLSNLQMADLRAVPIGSSDPDVIQMYVLREANRDDNGNGDDGNKDNTKHRHRR